MKQKARIRWVLIALVLAAGLMAALPATAEAAGNPYPTTQDADGDGYYEVPCTWYVWEQVHNTLGIDLPAWGNANTWATYARNAGYSVDQNPTANSIMATASGYYGHVAFVTSVSGNNFYANEGGRTDLDQTSSHGVQNGRLYAKTSDMYFIHLTAPAAVSVSFAVGDRGSVSQTNAVLSTRITLSGAGTTEITRVGVYIYNAAGQQVTYIDEAITVDKDYNYLDLWYDVNSELHYTLSPGTTYKYKFFAVVRGKTYWDSELSIKTQSPPVSYAISLNKDSLLLTKGDTATLVAPVSPSGPAVTWKSDKTSVATVANGRVTAVGAGTATITATAGDKSAKCVVTVKEPAPKNPFVDVAGDAYYYDAVLWAVSHSPQITNGTDATHFSPDATCTRAQVVTFLWRAKGSPEPRSSSNPFSDVKKSDYYYKAVLWAVENGVTKGTSATAFSPDQGCTRAQVVSFLWRAKGSPEPGSSSNPFSDVKKSDYYYKAVIWAVRQDITKGTDASHFSPDTACTRGQIVTFLFRSGA